MDHRAFLKSLSVAQKNALTSRSDSAGLLHLAGHVGLILLLGLLIGFGVPFWWLLIVPQGIAIAFLFTLQHECTHKTPFQSDWLNEWAGQATGFLIVQPFLWFRYFHFAHHRFTNLPEDDPELAEEGRERSEALSEVLKDVRGVIYSSQYRRTLQTVAPLEKVWAVEAKIVRAQNPEEQIEVLFEEHCDENVLISGHSNTLPNLISLLGITEEIIIEDDQYGDLFIVRWKDGRPELSVQQIGK